MIEMTSVLAPGLRATMAATCRQQGRSLLDCLVVAGEAALGGTAVPSLRPVPQEGLNAYLYGACGASLGELLGLEEARGWRPTGP